MREYATWATALLAVIFVLSNNTAATAQQCCQCGPSVQYMPLQQYFPPVNAAPAYQTQNYYVPNQAMQTYAAPIQVAPPIYGTFPQSTYPVVPHYSQPIASQPIVGTIVYPVESPAIVMPQPSFPLGQGFSAPLMQGMATEMMSTTPLTASCKACIPALGSGAYRVDQVPPSPPHSPFTGTHTHHYEMHQSPVAAGGVCFWHPTDVTDGDSPRAGEIPMANAQGGGVEE